MPQVAAPQPANRPAYDQNTGADWAKKIAQIGQPGADAGSLEQSGKYPIDRPCSACSAGDRKMKHHDHHPPFRAGYGPREGK